VAEDVAGLWPAAVAEVEVEVGLRPAKAGGDELRAAASWVHVWVCWMESMTRNCNAYSLYTT
jgi:hypothetical protein